MRNTSYFEFNFKQQMKNLRRVLLCVNLPAAASSLEAADGP